MLNLSVHVYRQSPQLATRIKVLLELSVEFRNMPATGSREAPNTPPSLPTTSNVEPNLLKSVVYLASTPRENQQLYLFDGSGGNMISICTWHRKV